MRSLLYLVAIAVCQGVRIPRGLNHHTPHFKAIYHGHGATSYQNVQIQNHDSIPVPNNYVEHIDNYHSFDHSNHDSLSIVNNYAEQEHHTPEHLTHLSKPIEKNYFDHNLADHYHNNEIHEVQVIEEVPHVGHHSEKKYIVPTLAPYIENNYQHLELESPEETHYYLFSNEHEYQ